MPDTSQSEDELERIAAWIASHEAKLEKALQASGNNELLSVIKVQISDMLGQLDQVAAEAVRIEVLEGGLASMLDDVAAVRDFIAAARRAAQAAADQSKSASVVTSQVREKQSQRKRIGVPSFESGSSRSVPAVAIVALVTVVTGLFYGKLTSDVRAPQVERVIEELSAMPDGGAAVASEPATPAKQTVAPKTQEARLSMPNGSKNAQFGGIGDVPGVLVQSSADGSTPRASSAVLAEGLQNAVEQKVLRRAASGDVTPVATMPGAASMMLDLPPAAAGPLSLRLAAAKGDADAQFEIATRFAQGRGIERNDQEVAKWHRRAAGVSVISSANVITTQSLLARLGYNPGPADGQMGPRTRDAILLFEERSGMPQSGRISRELVDRLRNLTRRKETRVARSGRVKLSSTRLKKARGLTKANPTARSLKNKRRRAKRRAMKKRRSLKAVRADGGTRKLKKGVTTTTITGWMGSLKPDKPSAWTKRTSSHIR